MTTSRKKSKKTTVFTLIGIVILVAILASFSHIKKLLTPNVPQAKQTETSAFRRQALNVNVMELKTNNLNDTYITKGQLIPDEEVDLLFETSGKITHIHFKEGTYVEKGTLLAKVNDDELQAQLQKLQAELPLAKDRVFRQKTLLEKDAVSREAYESVSTALATLEADIELIHARIRMTELRAPFSGIIGLRLMSEGAYASANSVISKLTKISPLKIEFSVNEKQANEIKPGTKLHFTVENNKNVFEASVYAVETRLDTETLSLKARALYPNTESELKPGHSASIEINLQTIEDAIVIPSISAIAEMGKDIVYVYRNGKAEQRIITKGLRTASSVQVVDGLQAGDTLIVSGVMQLRHGMEVTIDHVLEPNAK